MGGGVRGLTSQASKQGARGMCAGQVKGRDSFVVYMCMGWMLKVMTP